MKLIKKNFLEIIKNPKYYVPLIFVFLMCFTYLLTHTTVNIDTLAYDRYFDGTTLLEHQRFISPLLDKILNIYEYNPFFVDFVGLMILVSASTLMCAIIKSMTGNKVKIQYYLVFSAVFISYPLLPEYWTYSPTSINIALGYAITFISSYFIYKSSYKNIKTLILNSLLMMCAIGIYESFATVFLTCICAYLLVDIIINNKKLKFKKIFLIALKSTIMLGISILLKQLIAELIIFIFDLEQGMYVNKEIYYFTKGIRYAFSSIIKSYFISSIYYFPITVFVITFFSGMFYAFYQGISKNKMIILLYFAMFITVISLALLKGASAPYRTCQGFALFVAMTYLLIGYSIKNVKFKNVFMVLMCILVFYQAKEVHKWFYVNDLRYEEEKRVLIDVANELVENYDISKPIVVTGYYTFSEHIQDYMYLNKDETQYKVLKWVNDLLDIRTFKTRLGETNVNSYISWAITAFEENGTELNKWWKMLGYDFKMADEELTKEGRKHLLASYPDDGYIYDMGDYIIVNF